MPGIEIAYGQLDYMRSNIDRSDDLHSYINEEEGSLLSQSRKENVTLLQLSGRETRLYSNVKTSHLPSFFVNHIVNIYNNKKESIVWQKRQPK